tara:strand:- start:3319 stop:4092 length:774 start_codon:yes stop_codon:yes gene_type:complete
MATYNLKFNKDDSVIRHVIVGLLADLNKNVSFYRQVDNDTRAEIDVPFYYSVTGDDNFLRDHFLFSTANGLECSSEPEKADGNYDKVPRGVVNLSSMTVDPSKLINKRNNGVYQKMVDNGTLGGYRAEFEMIPITISVDVEIILSNLLDIFKCTEQLIKKLYKSNQYNVEVGHLQEGLYRIACYYAMPDDYGNENPIEYSFDDKGQYKLTFSIEVNSFMPSIDFSTERHLGNRMFNIDNNVTDNKNATDSLNYGLDS